MAPRGYETWRQVGATMIAIDTLVSFADDPYTEGWGFLGMEKGSLSTVPRSHRAGI